jgi:hypothetical protein
MSVSTTLIMSIQKLPLAALQQVRQYIKSTIALTDVDQKFQDWAKLDEFEDLPEPESVDDLSSIFAFGSLSAEPSVGHPQRRSRWVVSTVNPGASLGKLPGLSLEQGWRFVGYVYSAKETGKGVVWAVPDELSTTSVLEKAIVSSEGAQPPRPDGTFDHFMAAVQGDRSAASFAVASILRRELEEFGASNRSWNQHQLIDAVPAQAKWQWSHPQPADLAPKVKIMPDGQAALEFFTWRVSQPVSLFRHIELYPAETYISRSQNQTIAVAQR